jgi:hypothetical protein
VIGPRSSFREFVIAAKHLTSLAVNKSNHMAGLSLLLGPGQAIWEIEINLIDFLSRDLAIWIDGRTA